MGGLDAAFPKLGVEAFEQQDLDGLRRSRAWPRLAGARRHFFRRLQGRAPPLSPQLSGEDNSECAVGSPISSPTSGSSHLAPAPRPLRYSRWSPLIEPDEPALSPAGAEGSATPFPLQEIPP